MKVTITVDDNYLGQVLESAEVRAEEIEASTPEDEWNYPELAEENKRDAAFIRKAVAHVQEARERVKLAL